VTFAELFSPEEQRELLEGGAVVEEGPAGVALERTIDVPLRRDVLEVRDAADEAERRRAACVRRRRIRFSVAGIAALVVVGVATWLFASGQAERAFDARVAAADARLADGRVAGGGDSALDHLVAARALRPDDPAVRERLRLVADKLEELAERALARGDWAEAAVHLTAATQADPERKRLHLRLGEIARGRGRPPRAASGAAAAERRDASPSTGLRTSPGSE
jgi:hypothetical protein